MAESFPFDRSLLLDFDEVPGSVGEPLSGATILFLHGFRADKTQLRPIAEEFSKRGARCVLPSLRGHGESFAPEFGYSCLDLAADLHRLMAYVGVEWHIVGYSHGALVGAVAGLVLHSGASTFVSIDESFASHPERMVDDEHREARFLRWHFDWQHLLSSLTVPSLFLVAGQSHMVDEVERRELRSLASPKFQMDYISGTHSSCLEDPRLVDRIHGFYDDFRGVGGARGAASERAAPPRRRQRDGTLA